MKFLAFIFLAVNFSFCNSLKNQSQHAVDPVNGSIKTGAEQTDKYLPYLKGKRVAIMANPTTIIGKTHLVDSLKTLGVNIVKVFGPEHGFRGNASAGAHVADETDPATGIPVISLYGKKNKPTREDLADVDVLIYDLQDVG
ncbi:MAG: exo-beta-N-acetylmuramidase NamZ domain-containing protein, partial [Chitinophagaceae bacterium]